MRGIDTKESYLNILRDNTMAKYNVSEIKKEAEITRNTYRGKKRNSFAKTLAVHHIRAYIDKILFLIKYIEKLEKKL